MGIVGGLVLHHMIGWSELRRFWNTLLTHHDPDVLIQYLQIVGFDDPRLGWIVCELLAHRIQDFAQVDLMAVDTLAQSLAWQPYNLFEGPRNRPVHAPDPTDCLVHFPLSTAFDYPIVVPPHGARAQTLWRAYGFMCQFNDSGGTNMVAMAECFRLLSSVSDLGVIPAYDVNWFALAQARFWSLSLPQRRVFFTTCQQRGWQTSGDQVYAELMQTGFRFV
jgi:hypothetical protein